MCATTAVILIIHSLPSINWPHKKTKKKKLQKKYKVNNGKKAVSKRSFTSENALFALFRPKIRTWASMPLKGHIIAGFRGHKRDDSRYRKYLELIRFMQVPEIEQILLGKLLELKLIARSEIEEFMAKKT